MNPATGWSTQQLTEFLALVSSAGDGHSVRQRATERAAEALEAEVAALIEDSSVRVAIGFRKDKVSEDSLIAITERRGNSVEVPGIGDCSAYSVPIEGDEPGHLLVARFAEGGFSREEKALLRGMARVLELVLLMLGSLEEERTLRQQTEREISARTAAEADLRESRDRLAGLLNNAPAVIYMKDTEGRYLLLNPQFEELFSVENEAMVEKTDYEIFPTEVADALRANDLEVIRTARPHETEESVPQGGETRTYLSIKFPLFNSDGAVTGICGISTDITERKQAEKYFATQHAVTRILAETETLDEAIPRLLMALCQGMGWALGEFWSVDEEAGVLRSEAIWHDPAIDPEEFVAESRGLTFAPGVGLPGRIWEAGEPAWVEDVVEDRRFTRTAAAAKENLHGLLGLPLLSGTRVVGVIDFFNQDLAQPKTDLLEMLSNVSAQIGEAFTRKRAEQQIAHQALHDPLTGLPNRTLLLDRVEQALARSKRHGSTIAALFLDLDNFKVINDSLGHEIGDKLLVAFSDRVQKTLRASDTVSRIGGETLARLGGDEFVLLCEDLRSEQGAIRVAERIATALASPFQVVGDQLSITVSIGIAIATGGDVRVSADSLIRDADLAMYRAKEQGRDRVELFDEEMRTRASERLRAETELRAAIENDEFELFYQPIVKVGDGEIVGLEALLRWQHPERGLVPPIEFIPMAEEIGLITTIGEWVLATACRQSVRWREENPDWPPLPVSVNVSARQFNPEFPELVTAVLRDSGAEPACLVLEITESMLMEQADSPIDLLHSLRDLGVQVHLDDFGTGYSSLGYLQHFALDALKLDRSFVSNLEEPRGAQIAAAAIDIGRALGMTVVAEGVETEAELGILRELACPLAQGYHFCRPQPTEAITDVLRSEFGNSSLRGSDSHQRVISSTESAN